LCFVKSKFYIAWNRQVCDKVKINW
jgi:hypothetical protein